MLTEAIVRAARPRPKPYKLADSHRFYLLVTPSGGKLWRCNYAYNRHFPGKFGPQVMKVGWGPCSYPLLPALSEEMQCKFPIRHMTSR